MLEYLAPGFLYSVAKDFLSYVRGRKRRLTPEQVLERRQKWKKEIEPVLWKRAKDKLAMDVVIRDVKRLDEYPDVTKPNRKGISAWFKAGLTTTYHNGIEVNLGWHGLIKDARGWRIAEYPREKDNTITVALVACIPYERIEAVDWSGDNFYGESQVYCHFDAKDGSPFEDAFYFGTPEQNPGGPKFYLKTATRDEVKKNSIIAGTWWAKRKTWRERLGLGPKDDPE